MTNNKKITITSILILLLLIIPNALAVATPVTPLPNLNQQSDLGASEAVQNAIIREHLKTRQELKTYVDGKITEMTNTVKTDGQKFIDDNFRVLDQRMQDLATKFLIKIVIAIVSCVIFAQAIWFYFRRLITKKEAGRPKTITMDELNTKLHGLIHEEFAKKLEEEKNIQYTAKPSQEFSNKQPEPPTVEMIEKQIQERKAKEAQQAQTPPKEGIINKIFKKKAPKEPKISKASPKESAIKRLFRIKKKNTPETMTPTLFVNPEDFKNIKPQEIEEPPKPTKQTTMKDVEKAEQEKFNKELEELNKRFEEMQKEQTQIEEPPKKTRKTINRPTQNEETKPSNDNSEPEEEAERLNALILEQERIKTKNAELEKLEKQLEEINKKMKELE